MVVILHHGGELPRAARLGLLKLVIDQQCRPINLFPPLPAE